MRTGDTRLEILRHSEWPYKLCQRVGKGSPWSLRLPWDSHRNEWLGPTWWVSYRELSYGRHPCRPPGVLCCLHQWKEWEAAGFSILVQLLRLRAWWLLLIGSSANISWSPLLHTFKAYFFSSFPCGCLSRSRQSVSALPSHRPTPQLLDCSVSWRRKSDSRDFERSIMMDFFFSTEFRHCRLCPKCCPYTFHIKLDTLTSEM